MTFNGREEDAEIFEDAAPGEAREGSKHETSTWNKIQLEALTSCSRLYIRARHPAGPERGRNIDKRGRAEFVQRRLRYRHQARAIDRPY